MSDQAKCPYCGKVLEDELFYDFEDGDSGEMECDNCNKLFFVSVRRSVSYDIQEMKGQHDDNSN